MKISILPIVAFSGMIHAAGASAVGTRKAKKPTRGGAVVAGGHPVPPRARRTSTAKTYSEKKGRQKSAPPHSRRATSSIHTKDRLVTRDEPLRAGTRGGTETVANDEGAPLSGAASGVPSLTGGNGDALHRKMSWMSLHGLKEFFTDMFELDEIDECADMYDSLPPCPPTEVLALLDLTQAELACDPEVLPGCPDKDGSLGLEPITDCNEDFYCFAYDYIDGGSAKMPTCSQAWPISEVQLLYNLGCECDDSIWEEGGCPPTQDVLDELGWTDEDYYCEDGQMFVADECADMHNDLPPCPPTQVLALLNLTQAELACDPSVLPGCPDRDGGLGLEPITECNEDFYCFAYNYIEGGSATMPSCSSDWTISMVQLLYNLGCTEDEDTW